MKIEREEFERERNYLNKTVSLIRKKISKLGQELFDDDSKVLEFKKLIWDTHTEMDPNEMRSMMAESDLQVSIMQSKGNYLQRLFRIQNKPYFGSIRFKEEGSEEEDNIYIGITHVEDKLDYYVHDWRSPICSMFYDYETGPASYKAPSGIIKGNIIKKRQYIIEDAELKHIFDNDLNISDSLLQEVLAEESSDKMKNIVNTIQEEQNKVIRNTEDKNLIVEGIAGSGKTSVALHRIAFLLYRIPNLTSSNVVVFTPNKVFSEYISNVLPELGEDNTYDMTFYDLLCQNINEYKDIENFTAAVTTGAAECDINISPEGTVVALNRIAFSMNYRYCYDIPESDISSADAEGTATKADKIITNQDFEAVYLFLENEKANYSGMAGIYREFLQKNQMLKKSEQNSALSLALIMGESEKQAFASKSILATTFSQAENILNDLKNTGISDINFLLIGCEKGGASYNNRGFAPWSKLGGKKNLNKLLGSAVDYDFNVSVQNNF